MPSVIVGPQINKGHVYYYESCTTIIFYFVLFLFCFTIFQVLFTGERQNLPMIEERETTPSKRWAKHLEY